MVKEFDIDSPGGLRPRLLREPPGSYTVEQLSLFCIHAYNILYCIIVLPQAVVYARVLSIF